MEDLYTHVAELNVKSGQQPDTGMFFDSLTLHSTDSPVALSQGVQALVTALQQAITIWPAPDYALMFDTVERRDVLSGTQSVIQLWWAGVALPATWRRRFPDRLPLAFKNLIPPQYLFDWVFTIDQAAGIVYVAVTAGDYTDGVWHYEASPVRLPLMRLRHPWTLHWRSVSSAALPDLSWQGDTGEGLVSAWIAQLYAFMETQRTRWLPPAIIARLLSRVLQPRRRRVFGFTTVGLLAGLVFVKTVGEIDGAPWWTLIALSLLGASLVARTTIQRVGASRHRV